MGRWGRAHTASDDAREHCRWAEEHGMSPGQVIEAVTGRRYPDKQTWAVAERAVEASILCGYPTPEFIGVGMAPLHKWSVKTPLMPEKVLQDRNCMGCGQDFPSEGAHHRHCNPCRGKLNNESLQSGWDHATPCAGEAGKGNKGRIKKAKK